MVRRLFQNPLELFVLFLVWSVPLFFLGLGAWGRGDFETIQRGIFSVPGSNQYILKEALLFLGTVSGLVFAVIGRDQRPFQILILSACASSIFLLFSDNLYFTARATMYYLAPVGIACAVSSVRDYRKLCIALTTVGMITAIYGILQKYGIEPVILKKSSPPLTSSIGNKNLLAEFLLGILPFSFLSGIRTWKGGLFTGITVSVYLLTIYFCRTRSSIIGLFAIILFAVLFYPGKGRRAWFGKAAVLGSCLVIAGWLFLSSPLVKSIFQVSEGTNRVRILIWTGVMDMMRENPYGIGPGGFAEHYPRFAMPEERVLSHHLRVNNAHNDILQASVELGVPLFILAAGAILALLAGAFRGAEDPRSFVGALSVVGILTLACFGFPLHQWPGVLVFGIGLGFISGGRRKPRTRTGAGQGMVLLLVGVLGILWGTSLCVADISDYRGLQFSRKGSSDLARIEFNRAYRLFPEDELFLYRLGDLWRSGAIDYPALEKYLSKNVDLYPSNPRNHGNLAELFRKEKRLPAAAIEFLHLFRLDPLWDYSTVNLVQVYSSMGLSKRAVNLLDSISMRGFNSRKMRENRAFLAFREGDSALAASIYGLLYQTYGGAEYCRNFAVALIHEGDILKARGVLKEGREKFPEDRGIEEYLSQLERMLRESNE